MVGVYILSSHVEFSSYVFPIGSPVDRLFCYSISTVGCARKQFTLLIPGFRKAPRSRRRLAKCMCSRNRVADLPICMSPVGDPGVGDCEAVINKS